MGFSSHAATKFVSQTKIEKSSLPMEKIQFQDERKAGGN